MSDKKRYVEKEFGLLKAPLLIREILPPSNEESRHAANKTFIASICSIFIGFRYPTVTPEAKSGQGACPLVVMPLVDAGGLCELR